MIAKGLNITKEQFEKATSSLSYKWTRWFQYTWIGDWWYDFKSGIPSLWKWRKVAYKDKDWDSSFIYHTIIFKINNTANYIEDHKRYVNWQYDVNKMRTCTSLLQKAADDYYEMEYFDYQETTHTFVPSDKEGYSELESKVVSDNLDEYFGKYPNWKRKAIQYIKDNQLRYIPNHTDRGLVARIMGKLRKTKGREIAFNIMNEHIERWWD